VTVGGEALVAENNEASRSLVLHNAFPINIKFRKFWPELGQAIEIKTGTKCYAVLRSASHIAVPGSGVC
jgi:hypothetical protein